MLVNVNGQSTILPVVQKPLVVSELIELLAIRPNLIAVALNRDIIRKEVWSSTVVTAGDDVEIVHFVAGGTSH